MRKTNEKHAGVLVTILIGSMALAGCGDGGSGEEDADAADDGVTEELSDTGVDDAVEIPPDDGGGEDLVEDEGGGVALTVVVQERLSDGTMSPIEGATVALDAPGGGRTEDFTGADGRATFTGLDFSLGLATATAHKEGYYLRSLVTAGESDGEVEITLLPDISDSLVEISGTAENMVSNAHRIFVSTSTTAYSAREIRGPEWSTFVSPDVPFSLTALEFAFLGSATGRLYSFEFYHWTVLEHEAVTEPTTVVIDFSTPASVTQVQGSFALPSRPESPLRADGISLVHVRADHAYAGFSKRTDISADGESYIYRVEYVEVPGTSETRTEYVAYQGRDDSAGLSYVVVSGLPMEGENDFGHLDIPNMVHPPGPGLIDAQHLHDPIEWQIFDSGVEVILRLYLEYSSGKIIYHKPAAWEIELPADSTTAVVPELPSTVDAEEFFSEPMVFGRVWLHQAPDSGEVLERWSSGISFYLAP